MSFIAFAWIASFAYGFVIIVSKLTSKYSLPNPFLFNFLYAGSLLLFSIPPALYNHAGVPIQWEFIFLTGLMYALSTCCFIWGLYKLDATIVSPLYNFRTAFAVILAVIFLGEHLSLWQTLLVAIVFIGGLFVAIDERLHMRSFFQKPIFISLAGMVFLALAGIFTNKAIAQNGYWTTSLWVPLISFLLLFFTSPLFYKDSKQVTLQVLAALGLVGLLDAIGTFATNRAFAENVGISSVIISLPVSMILIIVLSIFFPKLLEKHTAKVYLIRLVAASVMILAALKLS